MVAGLIVGALFLSAEPEAPPVAPGMSEARRDALAKYGAAVWNLRRERLLTAAKQLEAAAKADPEATEPQKELAKLYAQLGREPEAIRVARKVLDKDPDDHDTAALLARLLFDAGEAKEAVAIAELAIESESLAKQPAKAVRLYRDLARLCEKGGDFAAAESALRKASEMLTEKRAAVIKALAFTPKEADTEAADRLERLGHVLVKRAKFDAAVEAFTAAAKLYGDPNRADDPAGAARLTWNLSGALEGKGDPAAALKQLEAFLKQKPRSPEPYQRLARLLRAAERKDEVVPKLQDYADTDKLNRPLAAVLAAEMARDPATRRAADELFAAITGTTADPAVVAVVVRSHLDTRRPVEIIKDLDRAFVLLKDEKQKEKKKPETVLTAAAKSFASEKARAFAAALEAEPNGVGDLLRAAADDLKAGNKRAHGTYYFLGSLAARHRQIDLAVAQFRLAARVAPRDAHVEAYSALFQVLWLSGKPAAVESACREALGGLDVNVSRAFLNFHLALALAEQGKEKEALDAADRTIRQASGDDQLTAKLRRHRVLCALGKWDEAIEYGNALLKEFDGPDERPKMRYAQSGAYWGAKKPAEAEKLLRAMLDDDPDHAAACNDLGYHLADQGRNLDEAERLVRNAITVDRIERRKAGSAEAENAAYIDSLGWVLFRQGKLADAKVQLEKAAALHAGAADPVVWDHLGDVLFRLGEKARAKAAWEKAKELYDADGRISARGRRDGRLEEVKRKLQRLQ